MGNKKPFGGAIRRGGLSDVWAIVALEKKCFDADAWSADDFTDTLAAFAAALEAGADGIETDIFLTKDGEPVCIHDDELNLHVAGADPRGRDCGLVREKRWEDIRTLDVGQGQAIPHLRQLFELAARYPGAVLHLELKGPGTGETLGPVVRELCRETGVDPARVFFTGFDMIRLGLLRDAAPWAQISPAASSRIMFPFGYKGDRPPAWHRPLKAVMAAANRIYASDPYGFRLPLRRAALDEARAKLGPVALNVYFQEVNEKLLSYARANGLQIFAWTMRERNPAEDDSAANFVRRHRHDPDVHLITDYPASMLKLRR